MAESFTKLNHRFGLLTFPVTFGNLKESIKQLPFSERTYYETTFKALKYVMNDNEKIHYIATADHKLLNSGGFIIIAESRMYLTHLKNSIRAKAEFEIIEYFLIKNVDFDIHPQVTSSMGAGSLILELNGILGAKKKIVQNVNSHDLDGLVAALRAQTSKIEEDKMKKDKFKFQSDQENLKRLFGPAAAEPEQKLMNTQVMAISRLKKEFSVTDNAIATIAARYILSNGKQLKGLLTATDHKVVFASDAMINDLVIALNYSDISNLSLNEYPASKELFLVAEMKKFTFEINSEYTGLRNLVAVIDRKINPPEYESSFIEVSNPEIEDSFESDSLDETHSSSIENYSDKYSLLKQIAELKNQGILTEEEFLSEKLKILNKK